MYAAIPAPGPACGRTTDNSEFACPPRMADGRAFTDYRTRNGAQASALTARFGSENARQWMMSNGAHLMNAGRQLALAKNACGACSLPAYSNGDVVPEGAIQICTAEMCASVPAAPHGFGLGRRFTSDRSDISGRYLSRLPGHQETTFVSRGVQPASAVCASDDDRDVAFGNHFSARYAVPLG